MTAHGPETRGPPDSPPEPESDEDAASARQGSRRPGQADDAWTFAFRGRELLVRRTDGEITLPRPGLLEAADLAVRSRHPIEGPATEEDVVLELAAGTEVPEGLTFIGLRTLIGGIPDPLVARAGAAYQTLHWHRRRRHCGRCGARTRSEDAPAGERRCPECDHSEFLNPAPAIIVLVHRGDRMLLARAVEFPEGLFSALAGFVEPGESLEDAVRREVREEVGVELEAPEYFASQPWPFPNSLMVGFTAAWRAGEIRVDGEEIGEAGWFGPEDLPRVPPGLSIARWMIDRFVEARGGDPAALRSWEL